MLSVDLSGSVAVVTGGSGGIGTAIVAALRSAGARAVSLDVVCAPQAEPDWIECDVRDDESVSRAIEEVVRAHGRLDLVVHAAGIARDGVIWKLAPNDWDEVLNVNLRAAFLLLRHAIPRLREAGGGRIVVIGSINGSRGKRGTSAYSASKAGLIGLVKSVAREVGRFGVAANVVEPGWVRTALTERADAGLREAAVAETQLGVLVEPEDVAAAVLFLCGPAARRITGQILRVDAGQYL